MLSRQRLKLVDGYVRGLPKERCRLQVIEECRRIAELATPLADAANRQFTAPVDDPKFVIEDEDRRYLRDLRIIRMLTR